MPRNMENSNPRLLISEILRKVSNAKTKQEKIDLLRKHNTNALRQLLIINFDDSVISELPEEFVGLIVGPYQNAKKKYLKNKLKNSIIKKTF